MAIHQLNKDTAEVGIEQFFDEICVAVLEEQREPAAQVGGLFGFNLIGEGGGSWSLDLKKAEVHQKLDDDLDLYIEMTADDFSSLLMGRLDAVDAIKTGRLRFRGEPRWFSSLAAVLQPAV